MTDRKIIESALQRVQTGELSPTEATEILLALEQGSTDVGELIPSGMSGQVRRDAGAESQESLRELTARLGPPPPDILDSWCAQFESIVGQHEAISGRSLTRIELDQWSISSLGDLSWRAHPQLSSVGARAGALSPQSGDSIEEFRRRWADSQATDAAANVEPTNETTVAESARPSTPIAAARDETTPPDQAPSPKRRLGPRAVQALAGGGIAVCICVGGYVLYRSSVRSPSVTEVASADAGSAPQRTVAQGQPDSNRPDPLGTVPIGSTYAGQGAELESLETLDDQDASFAETDSSVALSLDLGDITPPVAGLDLSLDSISEPSDVSIADSIESPDDDESQTSDADEDDRNTTDGEDELKVAGLEAADLSESAPDPAESPQDIEMSEISTSTTESIQLASLDVGEPTLLTDRDLGEFALEFPVDLPIAVERNQSQQESIWQIRDTRKNVTIASVASSSEGTELNWASDARESAVASSLAHGRITSAGGTTIFLRQPIESKPWDIQFDRADVRPTWNLGHPIPPRVGRLSVDFDLPDDVELAWIEPIDPESLRRTRALAVLTSSDSEDVSLGVRFDIRCSRKLSCRMRFAARLDRAMAWQMVTTSALDNLADVLTGQATLVSQESQRLARVQKQTRGAAREFLQRKRDRVGQQGELIRTTSQRVAQLQTLVAKIEGSGSLRLRVWVDWPDTEQTLLAVGNPSP